MITRSYTLLFVLLSLFASAPVHADLFQYTDKDGTTVFVDDEGKIPRKYRDKTKTTRFVDGVKDTKTSVRIQNNKVFVPVTLCYRSRTVDVTMLLDTGASTSTISFDVAKRLGIRPDTTEMGLARMADGRFLRTFVSTLDYLMVGPKSKSSVQISIMPTSGPSLPFDGLLGMDFLGDFSYHLDVNSQIINWLQ
ncbi:MAG: aspartyl protease family protein [Desulfuromonadales bacterium]|nr:aspartyl protease family protein [Desulfuromonadales bacterium]